MSRGEEPYSLAMLVLEHLGAARRGWDVQIRAIDIDDRVLAEAKAAEYGWHQVADLDRPAVSVFSSTGTAGASCRRSAGWCALPAATS